MKAAMHYPLFLFADGKSHDGTLRAVGAVVELLALAAGEPTTKPRRFQMEAYNGGAMRFFWSDNPVVVDLAGMEVTDKPRPIFKDHSPSMIVGHTDKIHKTTKALRVEGVVSGAGAIAREVVDAADKGFPWQASIGAEIQRMEEVRAGDAVAVNGQKFIGPLSIVRASRLAEVSFVALGADDSTQARMSAGRYVTTVQEIPMDFAAWLEAKGFTLAALTDNQKASLQASIDAESKNKQTAVAVVEEIDLAAVEMQASRDRQAAETVRVSSIRTVCASKHDSIEAQAIREGWNVEKAELAVLRASRPVAPNIGSGRDVGVTATMLEIAVLQAARTPEAGMKRYDAKVVEAADKRYKGRISLQELFMEAAWANGFSGRSFRQDPHAVLRAAFSTNDISGILSNVANKTILDAFMAVDGAWRKISSVRPANDFKTMTSYRMTSNLQYDKVGPTGEIPHGTLGELSYTNKVETYGKMLGITRQDLINDDLGALTSVPKMLGRGAGLKLNDVFWTEFLDNASFFATGNANYYADALAPLTVASLTVLEQKFLDQTDANGKPVGIVPRTLLVPTSLAVTASVLMRSAEVRNTTASVKEGTINPHQGKFEVVPTPYLNNSAYSGYSAVAWYLLADPNDMPVIETAFLNGQEAPTIESAEADFNQLGVQMRGYHDFGCAKQEYRGGAKSKGSA